MIRTITTDTRQTLTIVKSTFMKDFFSFFHKLEFMHVKFGTFSKIHLKSVWGFSISTIVLKLCHSLSVTILLMFV
jgi:hypothetical protein